MLGCTKESSHEDIKRAYHALALQFHPDKCPQGCDSLTFQRIQEAWNVLGQPECREEYDAACKQAELDSECVLVYARVKPNELIPSDENGLLSYKCRCGSNYLIRMEDLQEMNASVHIPCQECTFLIIVET